MTDREKQLIAAYLPHPRDPELGFNEYYVRDTADRIRKVEIREINPCDDELSYVVYEVSSNRRIDAGYGSPWIGFRKHALYDNKEDCKTQAHLLYNGWEELRELQEKEMEEQWTTKD